VKYLKIWLAVFLIIFAIHSTFPLIAGGVTLHGAHLKSWEKERKTVQAAMWNDRGYRFYKNKEYSKAAECFRKAVKFEPYAINYIVNLARACRKDKQFGEAQQAVNEALKKFVRAEEHKLLQIELADIHFWQAESLRATYDFKNAIRYYEKAYKIDKEHRLQRAAVDLNRIGVAYNALGQKQKALDYMKRSLPLSREAGDRHTEASNLTNMGKLYNDFGQKHKALEYYQKALLITQTIGDRAREAVVLTNIGDVHYDIGEKKTAIKYFYEALPISRIAKDRVNQGKILLGIGHIYSTLGQNHKALECYKEALKIKKVSGGMKEQAIILNNIARVYYKLEKRHEALEYYQKALKINGKMGNRKLEAKILNNIGIAYFAIGQGHKALEYYQHALSLMRSLIIPKGEAAALSNIGSVYSYLGQKREALKYFLEALPIIRDVKDREEEAKIMGNIGNIYADFGQNQRALEYYQKALPIIRKTGARALEGISLINIGAMYDDSGQKHNALEYYEMALPIMQEVGFRYGEAIALNNIGYIHTSFGQVQKAMEYFIKALIIARGVSDRSGEARILNNLMFFWESLKKMRLSIFFGKQSVNLFQNLRGNISGLNKKLQLSFLESKKSTYRNLAKFLITEGRLSEAQQVLDIIKEEEFFNFIRRDRSTADNLSTRVDFTRFEKQWLQKYIAVLERISISSSDYHVLKMEKNKSDAEKRQLSELQSTLMKETKYFENLLSKLEEGFDRHDQLMKEKSDPTTLAKKASDLQNTLKNLDEKEGGKNAALHYLVYEGRISVILTTPSSQSSKQTQIDEKEFNLMIVSYRNLIIKLGKIKRGIQVLDTSNDTLEKLLQKKKEYEKKLYDATFKLVDEELKKYGATNLTISLDGVLRYIPMTALWDGENYLVQRYRMALITPSSLRNISDIPVKDNKILGLGASRGGEGFAPLPYVGREIRSIVRDEERGYYGLINGRAFIDNDFSKNTLVSQLKSKAYPLVHISSHFKFSPGDETKNHLLLGDGTTMKLSEMRRLGKLFDNVKLLVLSACQTGVGGNGEEIDGFGELAQQSGAKSVIASLWPVADESTKELMVAFYRKLKEGKVTSKIEALRQAQLELAGLEDLLGKDKRGKSRLAKKKTKYSHSYYWGPFIMIGNWR